MPSLQFIGVTFDKRKGKFQARISKHGKCEWLGRFDSPEEAYQVWRTERVSYLREIAIEYEGLYGGKISAALEALSTRLACSS
jgi:hypothetical protein